MSSLKSSKSRHLEFIFVISNPSLLKVGVLKMSQRNASRESGITSASKQHNRRSGLVNGTLRPGRNTSVCETNADSEKSDHKWSHSHETFDIESR